MLIVDTGPFFGAHDPDDACYDGSRHLLREHPGPLVVPELVVAEAAHLAAARIGTDGFFWKRSRRVRTPSSQSL